MCRLMGDRIVCRGWIPRCNLTFKHVCGCGFDMHTISRGQTAAGYSWNIAKFCANKFDLYLELDICV